MKCSRIVKYSVCIKCGGSNTSKFTSLRRKWIFHSNAFFSSYSRWNRCGNLCLHFIIKNISISSSLNLIPPFVILTSVTLLLYSYIYYNLHIFVNHFICGISSSFFSFISSHYKYHCPDYVNTSKSKLNSSWIHCNSKDID